MIEQINKLIKLTYNLFLAVVCKNHITKTDLLILDSVDDITLADWSCKLKDWEWPEDLPDPKIIGVYIKNGRRTQLIKEIDKRVGAKFVNR